jgi:3-oxoacyl-[acyl-carrier-protein] synthase-1
MSNNRVVITGIGIFTALGRGMHTQIDAFKNYRTGITKGEYLKSELINRFMFGEIKFSNESLRELSDTNLFNNQYSRTSLLGLIAANDAIEDANLSIEDLEHTAFISATTVGGMDQSEKFYFDYLNTKNPNYEILNVHDCGHSTEFIAQTLKIKGIQSTLSTACSSSLNAIIYGARLIKTNRANRVIVGGTDAICKFTMNGFNSLMILTEDYCKSFDQNRNGLNLGEGAAYIVLEKESLANGKKKYGEIIGYANTCDAYHQTASSPNAEGAFLSMQKAILNAKLNIDNINYINAHGTATPNNDLSESIAIKRIFGDKIPLFSSTKGFTGHTLAAAGIIETVFSLIAIEEQVVLPNLNFVTPIEETQLIPNTTYTPHTIEYVLTNSFGFGGNNSTVIIGAL